MVRVKMPAILLSTLCYSFWLSFSRIGSSTIAPQNWPLIWLGFNTLMLCNPLPVYHRPSRTWLINRFARLLVSGLKRVDVRVPYALPEVSRTHHVTLSSVISGWGSSTLLFDPPPFLLIPTFFFGRPHRDQICSLNFSLTNLYFVGCVYATGFENWNGRCGTQGPHWAVRVVLSVSPFFCRFIQSLRRWYDSRLTAHLINVSNPPLLNAIN
jgi:hypothetical protein